VTELLIELPRAVVGHSLDRPHSDSAIGRACRLHDPPSGQAQLVLSAFTEYRSVEMPGSSHCDTGTTPTER
jgi:hypothetical protein